MGRLMAYKKCLKCEKSFFDPTGNERDLCIVCQRDEDAGGVKWHPGKRCKPTENAGEVKCPKCGQVHKSDLPITLCHGIRISGL